MLVNKALKFTFPINRSKKSSRFLIIGNRFPFLTREGAVSLQRNFLFTYMWQEPANQIKTDKLHSRHDISVVNWINTERRFLMKDWVK